MSSNQVLTNVWRQLQQQITQKACIELKNACMQNMSLIIMYNPPGSLPVQSVAFQSKKSGSAVTITANKMDANNKTIDSQVNRKWQGIHQSMYHISIGPKAPTWIILYTCHTPHAAFKKSFFLPNAFFISVSQIETWFPPCLEFLTHSLKVFETSLNFLNYAKLHKLTKKNTKAP